MTFAPADQIKEQGKLQTLTMTDLLSLIPSEKPVQPAVSVSQNNTRNSEESSDLLNARLNISLRLPNQLPEVNHQTTSQPLQIKEFDWAMNVAMPAISIAAVDSIIAGTRGQATSFLVNNVNDNSSNSWSTGLTTMDFDFSPPGDPPPVGDPGGGDPGGDGSNPGDPNGDVTQEVLINGNNDHGAQMVKYTQAQYTNGQPNGNIKDFPGYVPVNYEYDYKSSTRVPNGDPQIIPINWVPVLGAPIGTIGQFIRWKLTYTQPNDGVQRLKFWDSSTKRIEFTLSQAYAFTADPDAPGPMPCPDGIWPAAVEGIETSRELLDAGVAQLSLEYVQFVDPVTGTRPASIFVNFKPVKFTVTPVLSSLVLGNDSLQPRIFNPPNANLTLFGPKAIIYASFAAINPQYPVTYIQFVNSVVNEAGMCTKAIAKNPGLSRA